MYSTPADLSLASRMRALLNRSGWAGVSRLSDREVAQAARTVFASCPRLRSLDDIAAAIAFFAQSAGGSRHALRGLFDTAADLLDFRTGRDRGVLSAAQYAAADRAGAQIRAGKAEAGAIGSTRGGRWLLRWDCRYLIGGEAENALWKRVTERFIEVLEGEVKVTLEYPEFDRLMRRFEVHPLFGVAAVTRIVYWLAEGGRSILNPDPALFGAGVVKPFQGKTVIFRAKK